MAVLAFTQGCRSMLPTPTGQLAPETWIAVNSEQVFAVHPIAVGASLAGPSCPATRLEGRLGSASGDSLYLRQIVRLDLSADAEVHCLGVTRGYVLLRGNPTPVVTAPRYDPHRTTVFVVTVVVAVGFVALLFSAADWNYGGGSSSGPPIFLRQAPTVP
jgi:hypothetical protein